MKQASSGDGGRVRLASVGLGWWGGELAEAIRRAGNGQVVTCFARSEESRKAFAEQHGCATAESYETILEDPEVDGVLIATPHSTHLPMIRAAAEAGKHVFVEKPLTLSVAEAREAVDAAERHGIVLQVGHNRRKAAATRAVKQLVDAGDVGLVHLIEMVHLSPNDLVPRTGWRADPEECPLGGMTALGVHQLDNLHYLDGPVAEVFARSRALLGRSTIDDITTLSFEMESGALATLGVSVILPKEITLGVYGTAGAAWSELDGTKLYFQEHGPDPREERPLQPNDMLAEQMEEFARCIRDGTAPETGGREGLEVVTVFEAARISAATHRPVAVDEVRRGALALD